MAEACNIGHDPFIRPECPELTASRLRHIKANHVRNETIAEANEYLFELHKDIDIVKHWGSGNIASADGLRFISPTETAYARPN